MIKKIDKNRRRQKRHYRIRNKISGTAQRPRLNVFRSNRNVYAQLIDDDKGETIVASSTLQEPLKSELESTSNKDAARAVGTDIAKKALEAGVTEVVFDRGGYLYTGQVKELADAAREAGLKF